MIFDTKGHPVTRAMVDQVLMMVDRNISQRKIALRLDLNRRMVQRMIAGEPLACERDISGTGNMRPRGAKERCLICGAMVYIPCLLCVEKITTVARATQSEVLSATSHIPSPREINKKKEETQANWSQRTKETRMGIDAGPTGIFVPKVFSVNVPQESQ